MVSEKGCKSHGGMYRPDCVLCKDAEIAALKQENEGLKHGNDGWFNSWNVCDEDRKKLKQSLAAAEKRERELRKKVERYEALLDAPVVWEREVTKPQPR